MSFHQLKTRMAAAVAVALLGGLLTAAPPAPPPPPPPVPPGTIYFMGQVSGSAYSTPMSMKGDGTNKQNARSATAPSYQRHANSRWFLLGEYDLDGPVDEWGFPLAYELFAVNEQNQWVQLTADPNIHWTGWFDQVSWGKDDSFVAFTAWTFTGNENEIRGGLYVVTIDWSSGTPVAGAPTLLFTESVAYWFGGWQGTVNLSAHDWSPDGSAVVFQREEEQGPVLYVADLSGPQVQVRSLGGGADAMWSPDGSRIAFSVGEIWTIRPDGTGAVRITQRTVSKTEVRGQVGPSWSPDGAFIAYTQAVTTKSKTTRSVLRIPSAGGAATNLTSDLISATVPRWRP
jgi:hypothetical protein